MALEVHFSTLILPCKVLEAKKVFYKCHIYAGVLYCKVIECISVLHWHVIVFNCKTSLSNLAMEGYMGKMPKGVILLLFKTVWWVSNWFAIVNPLHPLYQIKHCLSFLLMTKKVRSKHAKTKVQPLLWVHYTNKCFHNVMSLLQTWHKHIKSH